MHLTMLAPFAAIDGREHLTTARSPAGGDPQVLAFLDIPVPESRRTTAGWTEKVALPRRVLRPLCVLFYFTIEQLGTSVIA